MAGLDEIDRGWDDLLGPDEDAPLPPAVPVARDEAVGVVAPPVPTIVTHVASARAPTFEVEAIDAAPAEPLVEPVAAVPERAVESFSPHETGPHAPVRRVPTWTFAAVGVPVVALIWYVAGGREPDPSPNATTTPTEERGTATAEPTTTPDSKRARERDEPPPAEPAAAPTLRNEADDGDRRVAPFDPSAVAQHAAAYEVAKQEYQTSKSPQSLEAMGLAACRMDDGAKARSAYRKMRDREGRKNVFWACRSTEIDLRFAEDGYTPTELVRVAARTLDAGDAKAALELARTSNNTTRSSAAILVMGKAYCALDKPAKAASLLVHLGKSKHPELAEACRASGHTLAE